jgi:DNA-binding FadR family transcriptional regulator
MTKAMADHKNSAQIIKELAGKEIRNKIWQSICRDTAHRNRLREIHYEIFEAINNKDRVKAISAMQEYYAVILIHYIQRLK